MSKERRLIPPTYEGTLRMTDRKGCMIFNVESRALHMGTKIKPQRGIVRSGDANLSDGSQYLS